MFMYMKLEDDERKALQIEQICEKKLLSLLTMNIFKSCKLDLTYL